MPELLEITRPAHEMKKELVGRSLTSIEVLQPRRLNLPE